MNTLGDLNTILFKQLDRLDRDDLEGDALQVELDKTKAVVDLSRTVISNAETILRAQIAKEQTFAKSYIPPKLLSGDSSK